MSATLVACSGQNIQESIAISRLIAGIPWGLSLYLAVLSTLRSWRAQVPNWVPVAMWLLVAINPFWFDDGQGGDCGAMQSMISPVLALISVTVHGLVVWWMKSKPPASG